MIWLHGHLLDRVASSPELSEEGPELAVTNVESARQGLDQKRKITDAKVCELDQALATLERQCVAAHFTLQQFARNLKAGHLHDTEVETALAISLQQLAALQRRIIDLHTRLGCYEEVAD